MRSLFSIVVCLCLLLSLQAFTCVKDEQCAVTHFCSSLKKDCTLKYKGFCETNDHCKSKEEICAKFKYSERGLCVPNPYRTPVFGAEKPKETIISGGLEYELVEPISTEEYRKIPTLYESIEEQLECGVHPSEYHAEGLHHHDHDDEHLKSHVKHGLAFNLTAKDEEWKTCWSGLGDCDNPAKRDTFTQSPNKVINLFWSVMIDGVFSEEAKTRISVATAEINYYWYQTGFQFKSYLRFFNTPYAAFKVAKTVCASPVNCIGLPSLIRYLRGDNWQQQGGFQVVPVITEEPTLAGSASFPWRADHGLIYMNQRIIVKGSTTLPHELGHAFGLRHTFAGISEVKACDDPCYENSPSDIKGDFCSDTNPHPKNTVCGDPDIEEYPDPCNLHTNWDGTPFTNIMTYGKCRTQFSNQQIGRARCYFTYFKYKYYAD